MTYPPRPSDDEPRSQPFQPQSYDLAPEYGNPQQPPSYQQPPYPQPVQQPMYPQFQQPVYTGPPPPFPPPPPPKKGNGLKITLGVLGAVFLVCAIAACVFLYPVFSQSGATVNAPASLPGGLNKQTSEAMQKLIEDMERDLRADIDNVEQVAAGIYSDDDPKKVVVIVAVTATILFPETELKSAFNSFEGGTLVVSGRQEFPAGELGGTLECANGKDKNIEATLCAWADHGSVGIGAFINRPVQESADLFLQIRGEVQTR